MSIAMRYDVLDETDVVYLERICGYTWNGCKILSKKTTRKRLKSTGLFSLFISVRLKFSRLIISLAPGRYNFSMRAAYRSSSFSAHIFHCAVYQSVLLGKGSPMIATAARSQPLRNIHSDGFNFYIRSSSRCTLFSAILLHLYSSRVRFFFDVI